jgi:lysophospholipase L1-like esterase
MKLTRLNAVGLLAGIAAGFALAVLLGYQASRYSKPSNFVRFQQWTNPQSNFFPPFRMLEHLALSRWQAGQTVVIVAGNSIFNGLSQPRAEIWSQRLQEMLGADKYVVVNLSFNGANPTDAGALVAESLLRRGIPVVLLVNDATTPPMRATAGVYGRYYWEAQAQSALLPYAPREADLRQWEAALPPAERQKVAELRRAAGLNARLYFQELWHQVGLRLLFTVWHPLMREDFWRPRGEWPDPEREPAPVADRFRGNLEIEMEIVRSQGRAYGRRDNEGRWVYSAVAATDLRQQIESRYPPRLRPHMLMVLCQNAAFYRRQFTPDEQARDLAVWAGCAEVWRQSGIACIINGLDFEDADYNDRTHLTASGGRKLAAQVAKEIESMQSATKPTP